MAGERPGDYRLILRPLASTTPAVVRLRRFLKMALRSYGLRAVVVQEVPADAPVSAEQARTGAGDQ